MMHLNQSYDQKLSVLFFLACNVVLDSGDYYLSVICWSLTDLTSNILCYIIFY